MDYAFDYMTQFVYNNVPACDVSVELWRPSVDMRLY